MDTIKRLIRKALFKPARWVLQSPLELLRATLLLGLREEDNLRTQLAAVRAQHARSAAAAAVCDRELSALRGNVRRMTDWGRSQTDEDMRRSFMAWSEYLAGPARDQGGFSVCPFARWGVKK